MEHCSYLKQEVKLQAANSTPRARIVAIGDNKKCYNQLRKRAMRAQLKVYVLKNANILKYLHALRCALAEILRRA